MNNLKFIRALKCKMSTKKSKDKYNKELRKKNKLERDTLRKNAQKNAQKINQRAITQNADNIKLESAQNDSQSSVQNSTYQVPQIVENVADVITIVGKVHGREFKNLVLNFSSQIIDGSMVEIIDTDAKIVIGTARLRTKNAFAVDKTSGRFQLQCYLTDFAFQQPGITLSKQAE